MFARPKLKPRMERGRGAYSRANASDGWTNERTDAAAWHSVTSSVHRHRRRHRQEVRLTGRCYPEPDREGQRRKIGSCAEKGSPGEGRRRLQEKRLTRFCSGTKRPGRPSWSSWWMVAMHSVRSFVRFTTCVDDYGRISEGWWRWRRKKKCIRKEMQLRPGHTMDAVVVVVVVRDAQSLAREFQDFTFFWKTVGIQFFARQTLLCSRTVWKTQNIPNVFSNVY